MDRTGAINAKVRATKSRLMFSQRTHPIDPIGPPESSFVAFHSVWVHLGPFRYCTKLGAKWAELVRLMQKFVPQSRVGCFHNERIQSTLLDAKLIFCCIS